MNALMTRKGTPFVWKWTTGDVQGIELGQRVSEDLWDENSSHRNAYEAIRHRVSEARLIAEAQERARQDRETRTLAGGPLEVTTWPEAESWTICPCDLCEDRRRLNLVRSWPGARTYGITPKREDSIR